MLTTSYFAQLRKIQNPVAITAGKPHFYTGAEYRKLAPTREILGAYKKGVITKEEYTQLYYADILDKLDPDTVYHEIASKFGEDATLLCYEKSCDFCHRHLVAEWLRGAGYNIYELRFM